MKTGIDACFKILGWTVGLGIVFFVSALVLRVQNNEHAAVVYALGCVIIFAGMFAQAILAWIRKRRRDKVMTKQADKHEWRQLNNLDFAVCKRCGRVRDVFNKNRPCTGRTMEPLAKIGKETT